MATRHRAIQIPSGDRTIAGTLVAPDTVVPGVMLVHGWDGSQEQYLARAHAIAALGCICLTFDLRGHASDKAHRDTVTREDNLNDMLAAYDLLTGHPAVDANSVAVVGSSYGGYLATVLSALRPLRWMALRAPALYKDEDWLVSKQNLDRQEISRYRAMKLASDSNRALAASAVFEGDVLLVESELDHIVPHPVIENYRAAFLRTHSMTYRVIKQADHSLSKPEWSEAYTAMLVTWMSEMLGLAKNGQPSGKK
ncbi:alpha/beta fold hydrolase [Acidovorax sp. sif1233]|jgi:pimeloyl-ACP methyl ester carboxylesterase|uniref:alpha/beta hydrolase family protein n=1 Tax=unclassified Acidovorax TaxID=2684926 RepID=UPI001C47AF2E|nr:alpha/beta fold hydrolase [Acidovorax sp. sif1233]MBV7455989.1 alpha/beta fold hydrolase [Acidovorax sp. sif1233]